MKKLKVGQKVYIIPRNKAPNIHETPAYTTSMIKFGGKIATISSIHVGKYYKLIGIESIHSINWISEWLIPIPDTQEELDKFVITRQISPEYVDEIAKYIKEGEEHV